MKRKKNYVQCKICIEYNLIYVYKNTFNKGKTERTVNFKVLRHSSDNTLYSHVKIITLELPDISKRKVQSILFDGEALLVQRFFRKHNTK